MKTIKQQIEKKEKEILILKEKLESKNLKPFKSKELNIEITPLIEWTKNYNQIIIPKGWRLLKTHECIYLIEEGYKDKLIGKFKDKYNYIWVQQTNYARKNNYSSGVYFDRDGNVGSYDDGLQYSSGSGRVAFCRELDALNVKEENNG